MAFQVKSPILLVDDITGQLGYKNPVSGREIGFADKYGSAIPFAPAPTGTMAANGAVTLGTALVSGYPNCYLYFPAGAIFAGSLAGWYYTVMSSATAGTVYSNNVYTAETPSIPGSPTAPTSTGPGAYTGVTGALPGPQITLPANSIGKRGHVRISVLFTNNNSAGTKNLVVLFGATTVKNVQNTTNVCIYTVDEIANRDITNGQIAMPVALLGGGSTAANAIYSAVDTTAPVVVGLNFNNNTATDWACIEKFLIEVIPGT